MLLDSLTVFMFIAEFERNRRDSRKQTEQKFIRLNVKSFNHYQETQAQAKVST